LSLASNLAIALAHHFIHWVASTMKFRVRLILALPFIFGLGMASLRADDASAEAKLKEIVARQKEVFAEAEKAGDNLDEENLRIQCQQLSNDYDLLLRRNPGYAPAHVAFALFLGKLENRKQALEHLLAANRIDPNLPLVKNQLGNYLAEEGKPIEAMNYYLSAIQLEPKEPLYHLQLGNLIAEARDDFLKSGQWTRAQLDKTMRETLREAAECAPNDWRFGYRYGLCFYDLETPDWPAALAFWQDLEKRMKPGVEQEACRLNQVKVLIAQKKFDEARIVLATVKEAVLAKEKEKLIAEMSSSPAK
jgi:tetratricopeptide (TPR) repeat protein